MNKLYDLIFVGSGISCTYTLIHLLEKINNGAERDHKTKFLVINDDPEFWTGIPYGNRGGNNSLIITPLKDFIPKADKLVFIAWLKKYFDSNEFLNPGKENDELSKLWFNKNADAIDNDLWDEIYVPRHLFGNFIKERITSLLSDAINKGLIEYDLLVAEVSDIRKTEHFYSVTTSGRSNAETFLCDKVVLGIGSPPVKPFGKKSKSSGLASPHLIENIYCPGIAETVELINHQLDNSAHREKNILVIGSNASSLELTYHLMGYHHLNSKINKLYILSSSGKFPNPIMKHINGPAFIPEHLLTLKVSEYTTAKQIFNAVARDIACAVAEEIDPELTYQPVNSLVIELVNRLDAVQQAKFVSFYGFEIGKFYRRAGDDYLHLIGKFKAQGKIEFIEGNFEKVNETSFQYEDCNTKYSVEQNVPLTLVINCTGSGKINKTSKSSQLIHGLLNQQICKVNASKKGLSVNNNFEAGKNLYVMGPLLAGNIVGNHKIWHAESCIRICDLSNSLAGILYEDRIVKNVSDQLTAEAEIVFK